MGLFSYIAGTVWLLIAIILFLRRQRRERKRLEVVGWPKVWGSIIEHKVVPINTSRDSGPDYTNRVRYSYQRNGINYENEKVAPFYSHAIDRNDAVHIRKQLDQASEVAVYVNPLDPKEAYLYPGPVELSWTYLIFFVIVGLLMPALILWSAWGMTVAHSLYPDTLQFVN